MDSKGALVAQARGVAQMMEKLGKKNPGHFAEPETVAAFNELRDAAIRWFGTERGIERIQTITQESRMQGAMIMATQLAALLEALRNEDDTPALPIVG